MIEELAVVTRTAPGQVWIKSLQSSGCGGCMQQAGCATATLAKLLPTREFAVACELSLQPGDKVRVAIDDSFLLVGSLLMYLLPLVVMLVLVVSVNLLLPGIADWLPELAMSSLLLAFWCLHRLQGLLLFKAGFRPAACSANPV